jgi:acyl-coenzyme A synthetase/AMP-(fatty) acid ligase
VGDRIETLPGGRMRLVGRDADLVKIVGKRASLETLAQRLLEIEGVEDGVFFLPESRGAGTQRLVCLAVAPTLTEAGLLSALRSRLDPAFLPRPLLRVERLPRNATGKLPRRDLLALFHALSADPETSS